MNFAFPNPTTVTLQHLNVRNEKHGDEDATALDLKFSRTAGNDCLDAFHPDLMVALYFRAKEADDQAEIEGVPKVMTNLRFPRMAPLGWALDLTGCTVVVEYGIDEASSITLNDCKVNKFKIEPAEGGSVTVAFRVQTSSIPDGALDKLSKLLNSETSITLELPEPGTEDKGKQGVIDGTTGHPGVASLEQARKSKKPADDREAGDIFADVHGAESAGA
jgi:hypothetical protein